MTTDELPRFDVFVSYRHDDRDRPYVRQLVDVLQSLNFSVWFDEHVLRPGHSWVQGMEQGLHRSSCGLVLIGCSKVGPWQNEEVEVLLRNAKRLQKPLIPIYLQGCAADLELPSFLGSRVAVDLRRGYTPELLAQLYWGITGRRVMPIALPEVALPTPTRDYIATRGHCVHKLRAKDVSGAWAYYFVLVEPHRERAFLDAIESGSGIVDLKRYGHVVASCYGDEPTAEIRRYLKQTYDFDV